MRFHDFELDSFQEEAISIIDKGHSVVVSAPTGSGKTLIADYIIDKEIKAGKRVIYTAPIKALSNQKYKDFIASYGEDKIGLITGDLVINARAEVLIMTTEVYRNMAITKDDLLSTVSYCIFDEIHYLGDFERGYVWEESIIFSPENVKFLFLSATIPNSEEFAGWISKIKEHKIEIVNYDHRPVPLKIMFYDADLGITDLHSIKKRRELDKIPNYDDASSRRRYFRQPRATIPRPSHLVQELSNRGRLPCIYFVFSRLKCQEYATNLSKNHNFLSSEENRKVSEILREEFAKLSPEVKSLKSTQALRECLSKGIGFHHAGILPDNKAIVEKLFGLGLTKVLYATETFAVGINMPAKTVCFDSLRKYTDSGFRYLNSKEFFQISGRAGRRGIDKEGLSVSVINRDFDDLKKISSFTIKDDLPIRSQFRLAPNTVLNMINLHKPEEIDTILRMNFYTFQELRGKKDEGKVLSSIKSRYDKLVKSLTGMGYIKDSALTELGLFTTRIYSEEIEISQIFSAPNDFDLDEYMILLVLAALTYEERKDTKFPKIFPAKKIERLEKKFFNHQILKKGRWPKNLEKLTAIINPCYEGKGFLEMIKNTNMTEGDIIRILMRVLDKLEQIDRATDDHRLRQMAKNCKDLIKESLKGIHLF